MVQRISIDIDKDLWKQIGFIALEEDAKKRELVEEALHKLIEERKEK